jgi:hypothetical protein
LHPARRPAEFTGIANSIARIGERVDARRHARANWRTQSLPRRGPNTIALTGWEPKRPFGNSLLAACPTGLLAIAMVGDAPTFH